MKYYLKTALVLACLSFSACGSDDPAPAKVAQTSQAVGLPNGGFVPYPKVGWDGTLVDLLAADAFGFCVPWWRTQAEDNVQTAENDEYLKHLLLKITAVLWVSGLQGITIETPGLPTRNWNTTDTPSYPLLWTWQRTHTAAFNVDPVTGNPTKREGPPLDVASLESRWSAYDLATALDATPYTSAVWAAKREAANELGLAGMNLCMASHLREAMLSADVLLASGSAQRELLEVIRQRAQLALIQFTLVGQAFNNPGTGTPSQSYQLLPALKQFKQVAAAATQGPLATAIPTLASDYARALRLFIDASSELSELLMRSASANSDLAELGGYASTDILGVVHDDRTWGGASWRGRLLNLLYGGDPLGAPRQYLMAPAASFNAAWGDLSGPIADDFYSFVRFGDQRLPHVATPLETPEPGMLLGLARQADAVYVAFSGGSFKWDLTAVFLYRAVEANLQRQACLAANPSASCTLYADDPSIVQTTINYTNGELWKRFGITPAHAAALARVLLEMAPRSPNLALQFTRSAVFFDGSQNYVDKPPQLQSDTNDRWLHLDPEFSVSDLPNTVIASAYNEIQGFFMPYGDLTWEASPRLQGFVQRRYAKTLNNPTSSWQRSGYGMNNESERHTGAVPVLAAVRDGLLQGRKNDPAANGQGFYRYGQEMLTLIAAAIGETSFAIRPVLVKDTVSRTTGSPGACANGQASCWAVVQDVITDANGTRKSKVMVHVVRPDTAPQAEIVVIDKSHFATVPTPGPLASRPPNHLRFVANAASSSTYTAPDFDDLTAPYNGIRQSDLENVPGVLLTASQADAFGYQREQALVQWTTGTEGNMPDEGVVVLLRELTSRKYFVLADGTGLRGFNATQINSEQRTGSTPVVYNTDGRYGSLGGTLNRQASMAMAGKRANFAKPAFTAFGLPTDWIPPTNPDLFGGNDGEDSVAFYLRSAKTAADNATVAVRSALDAVIAEKADQQKLQASRERSAELNKLEVEQLCGVPTYVDPQACNTTLEPYATNITSYCTSENCKAFNFHLTYSVPQSFLLLQPVVQALNAGQNTPDLMQYFGGSLAKLALDQFNAVQGLNRAIREGYEDLLAMDATTDAARVHRDVVQAQLNAQGGVEGTQLAAARALKSYWCDDPLRRMEAGQASFSWNYVPGDAPDHVCMGGNLIEGDYRCYMAGAFNPGPLIALDDQCKQATVGLDNLPNVVGAVPEQLREAELDAGAKQLHARAAGTNHVSRVIMAVNAVTASQVATVNAVNDTFVAVAKHNLDALVEQSGVPSQLQLSRRYHHYDFWRARALLEDARRLSAAARRAIETRFAVELSELRADEPFVAAPALWADEVYEYDLDAPSAVGLSATPPSSGQTAIYPNKLSDYVHNLENFVSGYSVQRPTATALNDAEIITIRGPETKDTVTTSAGEKKITTADANAWVFQCTDGGEWMTNPANLPPGGAPLNWPFTKNTAGPPFENEGFGPTASLSATGTIVAPVAAIGGNAVSFNNASILATPDTTAGESTGGLTIITWVNLRSYNASTGRIIAKLHQAGGVWSAPYRSVSISTDATVGTGAWRGAFRLGSTDYSFPVAGPIPLKKWTQLAVTFDGHAANVFMDGASLGGFQLIAANQPAATIDWGAHGKWVLGGRPGGEFIDGWIGPTLVDSRPYSAQRIADLYKKTVEETRPSIAWQFQETAAPFANTGTVGAPALNVGFGAPAAGQPSPLATPAINFNGSSSLKTSNTSAGESPSEITVSGWVYVRNPYPNGTHIQLITKNYQAGTGWAAPWGSLLVMESDLGVYSVGVTMPGAVKLNASYVAGLPRNQWVHVAATFDRQTLRLYLNGVEKSNAVAASPTLIDWGAHGVWSVGANPSVGTAYLNGMMADIRVEPRARAASEIYELYARSQSGACYLDNACVGDLDCCPERQEESPLRTLCDGGPPVRAKVEFRLDPWGRRNDYFAHPPYDARHNVRWGRVAVNLVGVGVRDCAAAADPTNCYAESFLRFDMRHTGPSWVMNHDGDWRDFNVPTGRIEGGKALAVEEWLDPIVNSWNQPYVSNVQRTELRERPVDGAYELELAVSKDVRLDRIDRVQVLMETNYWVREQ